MRRLTLRSAAISLVAISISIFTARVFASPLRSLIRAATSNNGQFLVLATLKLGLAGEGRGQAILGETFEVSQRETFIDRDRFTTPNKHYSSDSWKIELPRQNGFIAPWPIISDDGSTLVLVGVSPPVPWETLLAVYKKHGSEGQLLRSYTVDDLWDLNRVKRGWRDAFVR